MGPYELGQLNRRLSRLIDAAITRGHEPALRLLAPGDVFFDETGRLCRIARVTPRAIGYELLSSSLDAPGEPLEWFYAAWVAERRISPAAARALMESGTRSLGVTAGEALAPSVAALARRIESDALRVDADRFIENGL